MRLSTWGCRFKVLKVEGRAQCLGFGAWGSWLRVWHSWMRVHGREIWGLASFRVHCRLFGVQVGGQGAAHRTVLSADPEASVVPSADSASDTAASVCPCRRVAGFYSRVSESFARFGVGLFGRLRLKAPLQPVALCFGWGF